MCGGQDDHFHGCAHASYPPPIPYYDDSTFSYELNRNNEPSDGRIKEIKDMFKCLVEKHDEKQLQLEKQEATIHNLDPQLSQLVQALNAQQVNIVDSSQEEHEFAEELTVLTQEFRVKHQQPNQLKFEDADVEKVIIEPVRDIDDTNLADSSVIDSEYVKSREVHVYERIGPHSKHFSTLCTSG
ncbi:hypothetical protein HAX54_030649 [Datura stramonium]|uniref:Uncharacterized protein n=1 Tax=Datura stramonium TaxID=4076 RepID=A0ABS8VAD2_DATST|nr:hypothetical protein [Datura stramonium]